MRDQLSQAMKDAMKAGQKERLGTIRLMLAAIKDRELGIGGQAPVNPMTDADITQVLQKMVKQRRDSIETYRQGGRPELADKEAAEIAVIEEFLPKQMSEADAKAAIAALIKEVGAAGPKDMGKVMGALKQKFAGQMDFGKASGWSRTCARISRASAWRSARAATASSADAEHDPHHPHPGAIPLRARLLLTQILAQRSCLHESAEHIGQGVHDRYHKIRLPPRSEHVMRRVGPVDTVDRPVLHELSTGGAETNQRIMPACASRHIPSMRSAPGCRSAASSRARSP